MPLGYFNHIYVLILTITDSDETMDELSEKLERVKTIFKFIIIGPIMLTTAMFTDLYKFWINLYTKPLDAEVKINRNVISKESINHFVDCCHSMLNEMNQNGNKGTCVNFV